MDQPRAFGRRATPAAQPASVAVRFGAPTSAPTDAPDAAVEAFRASLRASPEGVGPKGEDQAFDEWLKGQRLRRLRLIAVRVAFLAPGAACFVLDAPLAVSIGLEILGVAANIWIRTERAQQARDIARWSGAGEAG